MLISHRHSTIFNTGDSVMICYYGAMVS